MNIPMGCIFAPSSYSLALDPSLQSHFRCKMLLSETFEQQPNVIKEKIVFNQHTLWMCDTGDLLWRRVSCSAEGASVKLFFLDFHMPPQSTNQVYQLYPPSGPGYKQDSSQQLLQTYLVPAACWKTRSIEVTSWSLQKTNIHGRMKIQKSHLTSVCKVDKWKKKHIK